MIVIVGMNVPGSRGVRPRVFVRRLAMRVSRTWGVDVHAGRISQDAAITRLWR